MDGNGFQVGEFRWESPPCSTHWPVATAKDGETWGQNSGGQIPVSVPAMWESFWRLVQAGTGWPRAESSLQRGGDPPGPLVCC